MFCRKYKVRYQNRLLPPTICPQYVTELNPGSRKHDSHYNFLVSHWNLNSTTAHNFGKINLVKAYNTIKKIEIILLIKILF